MQKIQNEQNINMLNKDRIDNSALLSLGEAWAKGNISHTRYLLYFDYPVSGVPLNIEL